MTKTEIIIRKIKFHSLHILGLLFLALTFGSIGIGFFVQNNPYTLMFDRYFYTLFTQELRHPFIDFLILPFNFNWARWAGPMPTYLYVMVIGALIFLLFKDRRQAFYFAYTIIIGSLIALLITDLNWAFVFRERPFITLPSIVDERGMNAWKALSSFPSGHARETALYSVIIASFIPHLRIPLFIFVIFIAFSRVYLGAHYPTDAIAGALIGFLAAKTSTLITREVKEVIKNRRFFNEK